MKTLNLKANINGVTISTVYNRFDKVYETLVIEDCSGDELLVLTTTRKTDAQKNHLLQVVHYSSARNIIHIA